ncbi:tRNA(Ile)-lysidine synthase [Entomoplasma freundtii]|uniref:tRNA(Ile)-lysidine synthase n=1 Tax=Entomoplasma freundtii TaxID=74700 RepID=A0A2K8NSG9_9MOLU|nr:tRNA lysidine(34) synthetase TilS [Entomoplasma freundtii]ATZ16717.1 tRNA(Ile)-lysidine synthase [Entomoplasma freundtii]TDY58116.1 tRNA(Ile)-lysidine synthase [Entomoplasma freundtii]
MLKVDPKKGYIVGVSGGPDSVYMLNELVKKKIPNLVIAHVNYHYRDDSDLDQQLVEELAKKHHIPYRILEINSEIYKTPIGNFEAWARTIRYDFFANTAKEFGYDTVMIAHNHNDHIETFLLQKERNNLVNHYGIAPKTIYGDFKVERPILTLNKSQILQRLEKQKIPYRLDSTNVDKKFARNRIRATLNEEDFPLYDQEIKIANQNLAKEMKAVYHYLKTNQVGDTLKITPLWTQLSSTLKTRILYVFLQSQNKNPAQNRKRSLLQEVSRRLDKSSKNFWTILVDDYYLMRDYDLLRLIPKVRLDPRKITIKVDEDLYLVEEFPNGYELFEAIKKDGFRFPYTITNDYQEFKDKLWIGKKTVKNYFNSLKTPYLTRYTNGLLYRRGSNKVLNQGHEKANKQTNEYGKIIRIIKRGE